MHMQQKSQEKWAELTGLLNNEAGPNKTTKEWKDSFHDLKTNVRRAAREIKQHLKGTGGGPSLKKDLTDIEERILSLINKIVIEGMPELPEGGIEEGNFSYVNYEEEIFEEERYDLENEVALATEEFLTIHNEEEPARKRKQNDADGNGGKKFKKTHNDIAALAHSHEECLYRLATSNFAVAKSNIRLANSKIRSPVLNLKFDF
ncbi:uncharacterized protein LOC135143779 [Zophobas morio]